MASLLWRARRVSQEQRLNLEKPMNLWSQTLYALCHSVSVSVTNKFFILISLSPPIGFAPEHPACAIAVFMCVCCDLKTTTSTFCIDGAIKIRITQNSQTPRNKHWNPIEEKIRKCVRLLKFCTVSRFRFRSLDRINVRVDSFRVFFYGTLCALLFALRFASIQRIYYIRKKKWL